MNAATPKVKKTMALPGLLDGPDQSPGGRGSDQVLVQWAPGTRKARQIEVRAALGGELIETILTEPMKANGEGPIDVLKVPTTSSVEAIIGDYNKQPDVIYAGPNQQLSIQEVSIQYVPNDAGIDSLWGLSSNGGGSKADQAWDVSKGSIKNVVGITDTGIEYTHPDLYKNIFLNQSEIQGLSWFKSIVDSDSDGLITFWDLNDKTNWSGTNNETLRLNDYNNNGYIDAGDLLNNASGWEDGIDNDGNAYIDDLIGWDFADNDNDPMDLNGHGTHVAGTIGAMGDNNIGVTGINYQIQMVGLSLFNANGGTIADAIKATDYFTDLKTRGLNGPANFLATNNSWGGGGPNTLLSNAISRADQAGILFIAAAGNDGTSTESYPAAYTQNNVISVASLESTGALASYSNNGSAWVDLGAPGSGIYSTWLNGTYGTISGTSMATPHVTGAAALLAAIFPTATAAQIKAALLDGTANDSLEGKTVTGDQLDLTVAINNLSKVIGTPPDGPTYSVATNATSYNEGQTITVSVNTTNVANDTTLYWAVSGTGIDSADFSAATLTGSGTITNGSLAFNLAITNDLKTEGTESLQIKLYSDSTLKVEIANSTSVAILDTSAAPVPPSPGQTLWGTNGNDVVTGGKGNDTISGIASKGKNLGLRQIDTLTGSAGADTFLLADARGTFYTDGNASSQGSKDYAVIKDFSIADGDKIQVKAGLQYLFSYDRATKATYFYLGNGDMRFNAADELIARFNNVNLTPGQGVWICDNTSSFLKTI